jgi:hypothetical protein
VPKVVWFFIRLVIFLSEPLGIVWHMPNHTALTGGGEEVFGEPVDFGRGNAVRILVFHSHRSHGPGGLL